MRPKHHPTITGTVFLLVIQCSLIFTISNALSEDDRVKEYHARNYTWPIPEFVPNTPGWSDLMTHRFDQLAASRYEKRYQTYDAYISTLPSALVMPNFTENGWGLVRAPDDLVAELKKSLHEGLKKGARMEREVSVIETASIDSRPLFVDQVALNDKALEQLRPLHEEWSGVPLVGSTAYGLRVYRNDSFLNMHVDKSETHIISCILHVDHDDDPDSEDWPIVIEDFQGNTNEVVLESGDMLFYESSKCLHGRPRRFKGKWYSSLFVHYRPVDWGESKNPKLEIEYALPPGWDEHRPRDDFFPQIEMVGTSMKEPQCEDQWCALKNSVKWRGPAIPGTVITTGFQYPGDSTIGESKANENAVKKHPNLEEAESGEL